MLEILLATAAVLSPLGVGNVPDKHLADPVAREATVKGYLEEAEFSFICGPATCTLPARGNGACVYEDGARRQLGVPLKEHNFVERVICFPFEKDLVLLIEESDGEGSHTKVLRLGGDELRLMWEANYPAFNTGEPLVVGRFAYVTGIGFVGKIDLSTGRFGWSHKDLYVRPDVFNSFKKPSQEGGIIFFKEAPSIFGRTEVRVLKVDDATGKILVSEKDAH